MHPLSRSKFVGLIECNALAFYQLLWAYDFSQSIITNRPKAEHYARTHLINMAEEDEQMEVAEEVEVEEVEAAPAAEMTVVDGLKEVLKKALIFDGLRRGLHE